MSDTTETTMPALPVRATTPDTKDRRLIAEMRFGVNYSPAETLRDATGSIISKEWEPTSDQQQEEAWVRKYLASCMCVYACDIETLGCTGVAKFEAGEAEAVRVGTRLRLGLGGGGVGLPCFVPADRFCLVHNTIGGLQDHQQPLHPEYIDTISRALLPQERVQAGLTEKARRMRGGERTVDAMNVLTGQDEEAIEEVASRLEDAHDEKVLDAASEDDSGPVPFIPLGAQLWKCTEHTTLVWACRHCLAQAVVEGALVPFLAFSSGKGKLEPTGQVLSARVAAGEVESHLAVADAQGLDVAELFVRVATFTRKLSRD